MLSLVWCPLQKICYMSAMVIIFTGFVVLTGASANDTTHNPRPNILLIVAEDMSSRVNAFGDVVANTPTIDALATMRAKIVKAVTDPADVEVPPYYPDTPEVRASIAQHYDNIHYMDAQVQQILANLEADGLSEKTIVIWTTDHGDGLPRAKRTVFDNTFRSGAE